MKSAFLAGKIPPSGFRWPTGRGEEAPAAGEAKAWELSH